MAQIIPQTSRADFLAQGLTSGLSELLQGKMQQIQQQKTTHGLSALGFSPEQSKQLSGLPPALLGPIIKNYLAAAENSGLEEALGALSGGAQQNTQQIEQDQPQQMMAQQQQNQKSQFESPMAAPKLGKQLPTSQRLQSNVNEILQGFIQNPQQQQQVEPQGLTTPLAQEAATKIRQPQQDQQKSSLKNILQRPRLNAQHKIKLAEMQQRRDLAEKKLTAAERKEQHAEQLKIESQNKEFRSSLEKRADSEEKSEKNRRLLRSLVKSGKLIDPNKYNELKQAHEHGPRRARALGSAVGAAGGAVLGGLAGSLGGPAGTVGGAGAGAYAGKDIGANIGEWLAGIQPEPSSVIGKESNLFEKTILGEMNRIKDIYPGRILAIEVENFLKTLPTLAMPDDAKERVLDAMDAASKGVIIERDAMNEILRENHGKEPRNLRMLVQERAKPRLDKLFREFESDIIKAMNLYEKAS